jgi:hypothetical protein
MMLRFLALALIALSCGSPRADESRHWRIHAAERSAWNLSFSETGRDGASEIYAENFAPHRHPGPADWGAIQEVVGFCRDHKPGFEVKTDGGAWGYSFWGPAYYVAYWVNADPPAGQLWLGGESVNAAVFPGDAAAFLATLPDDGVITFRVTDSFGRDHEAGFRLKGIATVRRLIAEACAPKL